MENTRSYLVYANILPFNDRQSNPPIPMRPPQSLLWAGLGAVCFVLALSAPQAGGALHITEFLANNDNALDDEDGDASDWVELFNSGPGNVDLDGYYLTDDPNVFDKWRFPAESLPEGGFLLVFASGKDRAVAGLELHTNFRIASGGEYLALVEPDGSTVVAEFGAAGDPLPEQYEDISYGLMQGGGLTPTVLVGLQGAARVLVPADNALGGSWSEAGFDDSAWDAVEMGIGYDENATYGTEFGPGGDLGNAFNGVNTSVYIRIPFDAPDAATVTELTLRMKYDDGFVAYLNDTIVADANAPGGLTWNSGATGNHSDGSAVVFQDFDISAHAHLLQSTGNVLAIHGLNDGLTSSDMLIAAELHAMRVTDPSLGGPGYLANPSPRTFNGDTFGGFVGDTTFNVDRGFFETGFDLEITSTTEGAEICYTLDGSRPSATQGQIYSGPIRIDGTTVVRAMAHLPGFRPTNVDTQTYLFPTDVVDQPRMRTSVTQSPTYGPQMVDSLKAVPTISLVADNPGPFQNEGGGNIRSETPASIEMIFPDGTTGFQENAGMKHFGGYYTNFRKKSFRVAFRSDYGVTKLRYPIFEGTLEGDYPPAEKFDILDLRSGSHDMRSRGAYMSNRFCDDSMLEMGNLAPHGRFVHLYLNGEYWGQYHLRERWNADMASSYFGGRKEEYDAVNLNDGFRNDEKVYDGDGVFWAETKTMASSADPWANNNNNIDVPNIIDFMLLWVSGNSESETRLSGSKYLGHPFRFMMKDADGWLRNPSHSVTHSGPLNLMSGLRSGDPDFSMLIADRIHMHYFNDGAFTPARNIARLQRRVDEARMGFISEAARWGDEYREHQNWLDYQNNLLNNHFPGLTQTMINRFKSGGMYPDILAPVFSQHGGSVSTDTPLTMSTDADTIYYTTDGSDPRLPGGAPDPSAQMVSFNGDPGGGPVPVTYLQTGHVWRYLDDGSDQGTAWRDVGFADSGWASGPSSLGYGNDGEGSGTLLGYGPEPGSKYATTYFRSTVDIDDPSMFFDFLVRVKYDDGIAIYVNGVERLRQNLAGNASYDTYASGTIGDEANWKDFRIPKNAFVDGTNTLAVEIHQGSGTSSDIRFDMVLRGETEPGGVGDNVSDPIFLSIPTRLRARARNSGSGEWSALNEAVFRVDTIPADGDNLVISELHYHPAEPTAPAELAINTDRDDYEFIEIENIAAQTLALGGVEFTEGINFDFPETAVLSAGERLLLVRNLAAFEARYGAPTVPTTYEYTGRLSNDGEQITITGADPTPIQDFVYNDQVPWPTAADGEGYSLVLVNSESDPDHGDPANWTAGRLLGGSPGEAEPRGNSYDDWGTAFGLQGGAHDDDDGDGIRNFFEFLFGSHPLDASDAPVPSGAIQTLEVDGTTDDYFTLSFRQSLTAEGAALVAEVSTDLTNWVGDAGLVETVSRVDNGDGTETVTIRLTQSVGELDTEIYLRLRGG